METMFWCSGNSDVFLVSLLLTLNRFYTLFWCFHSWTWIIYSRLGRFQADWIQKKYFSTEIQKSNTVSWFATLVCFEFGSHALENSLYKHIFCKALQYLYNFVSIRFLRRVNNFSFRWSSPNKVFNFRGGFIILAGVTK